MKHSASNKQVSWWTASCRTAVWLTQQGWRRVVAYPLIATAINRLRFVFLPAYWRALMPVRHRHQHDTDKLVFRLGRPALWRGGGRWYWCWMHSRADLLATLHYQRHGHADIHIELALVAGLQRVPLYIPHACSGLYLHLPETTQSAGLRLRWQRRLDSVNEASAIPRALQLEYEKLNWLNGNVRDLRPVRELTTSGIAGFRWQTDGGPAIFEIPHIVRVAKVGWHMVELQIFSNRRHADAALFLDMGDGYPAEPDLVLPFRNGSMVKRLCFLHKRPRGARLVAIDGDASFSIRHLHFSPIPAFFAYDRMCLRLSKQSRQFQQQPIAQVRRSVRQLARQQGVPVRQLLTQLYDQTFPLSGRIGEQHHYADWISRVEAVTIQRLQAPALPAAAHLVWVLTVSADTAAAQLQATLHALQTQTYPHWTLLLHAEVADEVSTLVDWVKAQEDERIHWLAPPASWADLVPHTGMQSCWLGWLHAGDRLPVHALQQFAQAAQPGIAVIYSDEDHLDDKSARCAPRFKPDWSPDLLLSQPYLGRAVLCRMEDLFALRAAASQYREADGWVLQHLAALPAQAVTHIPHVLYHAASESVATPGREQALAAHFLAAGQHGVKVGAGSVAGAYRIQYPVPEPEPLVSLLIPTRDMLDILRICVDSILEKTSYQHFELVILDNQSVQAQTLDYFAQLQQQDARVRVLPYPYPFNYSALTNFGVNHAFGDIIGLINNDTEVISPDWLTEMVSQVLRPEIGCVGAKLYFDDDTLQHAGVILGIGGIAGHSHKYFHRSENGYCDRLQLVQNLSAVTAACLLVRKQVFNEVGGFNETALQVAYNDVDFCLRVGAAGYRNLWTPYAELYHHESKTRGREDTPDKLARFRREVDYMQKVWGERLRNDPYYNPNLSLQIEDFSIR
ncbi:glycosyltransferase family 2 protein [Methylobacillus flagellatus]|uniref:glycosyltransferase family 2 protein n=1 Tax=Methylobacillus flagellatus TaxID=405 RepID=UPI0014859B72|nr:glycosyltransferase family 2 protein [Methylobacillus flagellatus]